MPILIATKYFQHQRTWAKMYNNDKCVSTDLLNFLIIIPSNLCFHYTPAIDPEPQSSDRSFNNFQFSDSDILNYSHHCKACGIDNLNPKMIKYCTVPLLKIFAICLHKHILLYNLTWLAILEERSIESVSKSCSRHVKQFNCHFLILWYLSNHCSIVVTF